MQLKGSSAKKRLIIRNPNDEMFRRWLKNLSLSVPTVDLSDLSNQLAQVNAKKRQFAPELSQTVYNFMFSRSYPVGDYTAEAKSSVTRQDRANMVNLIE